MDKVTLSKQELKQLKGYIESRGFREPLVVMEILDHFACLVEDMKLRNPELSIDAAMKEAHSSFGVMGFKTIADAVDVERSKRFRKFFRQHLKSLFINPLSAVIVILSGMLCYKIYSWLLPFEMIWMNGWLSSSFIYVAIFLIAILIMHKKLPDWRSSYGAGNSGFMDNGYPGIIFFVFVVINPQYSDNGLPLWPFALGHTVFTMYLIIHMIAQYKTMKNLVQEGRNSLDLYAELN